MEGKVEGRFFFVNKILLLFWVESFVVVGEGKVRYLEVGLGSRRLRIYLDSR